MKVAVEQYPLNGPERPLRSVAQEEFVKLLDLDLPVHPGVVDPFGQQLPFTQPTRFSTDPFWFARRGQHNSTPKP